jgi:hypothetical protein
MLPSPTYNETTPSGLVEEGSDVGETSCLCVLGSDMLVRQRTYILRVCGMQELMSQQLHVHVMICCVQSGIPRFGL